MNIRPHIDTVPLARGRRLKVQDIKKKKKSNISLASLEANRAEIQWPYMAINTNFTEIVLKGKMETINKKISGCQRWGGEDR